VRIAPQRVINRTLATELHGIEQLHCDGARRAYGVEDFLGVIALQSVGITESAMSASQIHDAGGINAKAAVRAAKDFVADMFADESPTDIGLEEITFDPDQSRWHITIGFTRPWEKASPRPLNALAMALTTPPRIYKVVTLTENGEVQGLVNRDV
jgi:hypothetical protein